MKPAHLMRKLLALVFVVLVACLTACAGSRVETPIAPSNGWIASLLGSPSNISIVVRPNQLMTDPYWGPAMQRSLAKPDKKHDPDEVPNQQLGAFMRAQQLEAYIVVRDWSRAERVKSEDVGVETLGYAYVVRGLPVTDPLTLTTKRGERLFAPPTRLPSGVLEFPPNAAYAQHKRGLAATLFIMPDGTWVGVDSYTAQRAHGIYGNTGQAPPAMEIEANAMLGGFVDAAVIEAASRRAETRDDNWKRGLVGAGLVLHGGRDGAIEGILDYAKDGDAERSADWMKSELRAACKDRELACVLIKTMIRDVKVSADDRRVSVRFYFSELLLRKLAEP
jgi:hypothetical protein